MPQLDPTWYVSQLFWLCVCFFCMLFIMSKFIAPRIADILAQRQRKIDDYLKKAHDIKEEAEASLNKYHQALEKATSKANQALEQTQKELNAMVEQKQNDLAQKLQKEIKDGEALINQNKADALKQVQAISEELAQEVLKKIGLKIPAADIKKVIKTLAEN